MCADWLEWAKLFATVGLGLLAFMVADGQRRIAAAKLKFDLFERRLEIFDRTWQYLSKQQDLPTPIPESISANFSNSVPEAGFIFPEEIAEYMIKVQSDSLELSRCLREFNALFDSDPRRAPLKTRITELNERLGNEARGGAAKKFGPYLDFKKWT